MAIFLARRLVLAVVTLFGVTVVIFSLIQIAPGDVVTTLLGMQATGELRERFVRELGLDKPLPVQYVAWMKKTVRGDLGRQALQPFNPVKGELARALKNTAILALAGGGGALILGVMLGTVAAFNHRGWADRLASGLAMTGVSVPDYWLAILLIVVFSVHLGLLPSAGMETVGGGGGPFDRVRHLVLPAIALGMVHVGILTRMVRTSVLEILSQEFMVALRAKGIGSRRILGHVLKNAFGPVLTVIGLQLAYLMGGAVFVETVFSWPGIGSLAVNSIQQRDFPMIMGVMLLAATIFVAVNLGVDIVRSLVDPRIRRI